MELIDDLHLPNWYGQHGAVAAGKAEDCKLYRRFDSDPRLHFYKAILIVAFLLDF